MEFIQVKGQKESPGLLAFLMNSCRREEIILMLADHRESKNNENFCVMFYNSNYKEIRSQTKLIWDLNQHSFF